MFTQMVQVKVDDMLDNDFSMFVQLLLLRGIEINK